MEDIQKWTRNDILAYMEPIFGDDPRFMDFLSEYIDEQIDMRMPIEFSPVLCFKIHCKAHPEDHIQFHAS